MHTRLADIHLHQQSFWSLPVQICTACMLSPVGLCHKPSLCICTDPALPLLIKAVTHESGNHAAFVCSVPMQPVLLMCKLSPISSPAVSLQLSVCHL